MYFKRGDVVFHKTEDFGVGCVKDTNRVDKILVEFGTIGKEGYRREWMPSSDVEFALEQDTEREM